MIKARFGRIINIGSVVGAMGNGGQVNYTAAKAGLEGFGRALAREVGSRAITVNAVAPGPINTPLVRSLSEDWQRAKAAELPLGRFGEPQEVADTVAFLCSPQASLFVGQTLGPNSGDVML